MTCNRSRIDSPDGHLEVDLARAARGLGHLRAALLNSADVKPTLTTLLLRDVEDHEIREIRKVLESTPQLHSDVSKSDHIPSATFALPSTAPSTPLDLTLRTTDPKKERHDR